MMVDYNLMDYSPIPYDALLDGRVISIDETRWYYEPYPSIIFTRQKSTLELDVDPSYPRITNPDLFYPFSDLTRRIPNWYKGIALLRTTIEANKLADKISRRGGDPNAIHFVTSCAILTPSNLHGLIHPIEYARALPLPYYLALERIFQNDDMKYLVREFLGINSPIS